MTREEARKAAEVMLAYAEGKEIEGLHSSDGWIILEEPLFNWDRTEYRIKPEPTYRPFKDKEECWNEMQKHQPFGWVKGINDNTYRSILSINDSGFYKDTFDEFTFADGTPFGIKEE